MTCLKSRSQEGPAGVRPGPSSWLTSGLTWALGSRPSAHQVRGFYRGLLLPISTVSLVSSLSFGTYHQCLTRICRFRYGSADAKPARTDITLSGFASGLVRVSGVPGPQGWGGPEKSPEPRGQGNGSSGRAEARWRLGAKGENPAGPH